MNFFLFFFLGGFFFSPQKIDFSIALVQSKIGAVNIKVEGKKCQFSSRFDFQTGL